MTESVPLLLPPRLADEISSLNPEQKRAVLAESHTVVLAGPGAGKTKMLVSKAAYVSFAKIHDPQRVACMTFASKAAEEIRKRLRMIHPAASRAVICDTVHAFCLAEILKPFSVIAGYPPVSDQSVINADRQSALRVSAYSQAGLKDDPRWNEDRDTSCRRAIYADESLAKFAPRVIAAMQAYDKLLEEEGVLDFEAMVGRSLQILRDRAAVRRLVVARFPWLLVDEYQDLGPVLHAIVGMLRAAGARIFAVGDPDQCIHGFIGSDPRYLVELSQDPEFLVEQLEINYRTGQILIDAAIRVLGMERNYRAHDVTNVGTLNFRPVPTGPTDHGKHTARAVVDLVESGVPPHEIGILYSRNRKKAPVRDWLADALRSEGISTATERGISWPRARTVTFLQKIASWQLARAKGRSTSDGLRFEELADEFARLRATSLHRINERLAARVDLWHAIARVTDPNEKITAWLGRLVDELDLIGLVRRAGDPQEEAAVRQLASSRWSTFTVADLAGDVEVVGKVALTTYHSSKGREWLHVILPALQEGIVPGWPLDYGRPYDPSVAQLADERRLFYVALTRARSSVTLIYTPGNSTGLKFLVSSSRFIVDLRGSEPDG
ncbi:putative UvrD/REP helicase [Parafrankia sp. Ea1.12]|uniref:ATP-dependent helicase n=1 Tax=Parafrankia sp. Ea1.12 TaxID=573499 RepID=UPI000DA5B42A|nr:ATP-dependent helicase [Parafrankia sp. Ea1.12]SQD95027.1 putative UvrD/REP helicase [Parafrankia sp. Ea1.12]